MNPRPLLGIARLAVGTGLAGTLAIQIADRVTHHAFDPWEYFSYFTIETSVADIGVLLTGGALALTRSEDPVPFTSVRMTTLTYAAVTASVYNLLLRRVPYEGYQGLGWPNEVIHVAVPALLLLDWLFAPGRPAVPWSSLRMIVIYPVVWAGYTFLRARLSGPSTYPYPFLNPANGGWGRVGLYVGGLTGTLVGLGALAVRYSRRTKRYSQLTKTIQTTNA